MIPERIDANKTDGKSLMDNIDVVMFDLDSTVVDTVKPGIKRFKEVLVKLKGPDVDLNFDGRHISRWDQLVVWALERGVDEETAKSMQNIWNEECVMREAEPVVGIDNLIREIAPKKKLIFPTSRPSCLRQISSDWLKLKVSIKTPRLYIRKDSDICDGLEFKANSVIKTAKKHSGRALYIEDFPAHALYILKKAKEKGANLWVILVPYPNVPIDEELYNFVNLIILKRDNDLGLSELKDFLMGVNS